MLCISRWTLAGYISSVQLWSTKRSSCSIVLIFPVVWYGRLKVSSSFQRLYFRNANHPIARPSVITRRQDRSAANFQIRAMEQGTEKEADRRFVCTSKNEYRTLLTQDYSKGGRTFLMARRLQKRQLHSSYATLPIPCWKLWSTTVMISEKNAM